MDAVCVCIGGRYILLLYLARRVAVVLGGKNKLMRVCTLRHSPSCSGDAPSYIVVASHVPICCYPAIIDILRLCPYLAGLVGGT